MLLSYAVKETWVIKFYFFDCSQSVFLLFIENKACQKIITPCILRTHGMSIGYYFLASSM